MTTWITICDTCKRDEWDAGDMSKTDGERLAELIENGDLGEVKTRRVSCLMGCNRSCNIAIQAPDKLAYTLGEFEPDEDAANAIIEYARKHAASESGQVPYREWPQGVKGHFVTRHAPLPKGE